MYICILRGILVKALNNEIHETRSFNRAGTYSKELGKIGMTVTNRRYTHSSKCGINMAEGIHLRFYSIIF